PMPPPSVRAGAAGAAGAGAEAFSFDMSRLWHPSEKNALATHSPTAFVVMIASPSLGLLWFVEPPLSDEDRAPNVIAERGAAQPESAPRQHQRRPAQHQRADRKKLRDRRGLAERAGPEVVAQPV